MPRDNSRTLRVVALMEATTVTGPAKNLFAFAALARTPSPLFPHGAELSIITFSRGADSNAFIDQAREKGILVDVIREERAFQFSILGDLKRVIQLRKPDIIQTHNVKSHFLVRMLNLNRRHAWVAYHHGYTSTNLKVHAYNQINRWSLRAAKKVIVVCGPFADQLARSGVKRDRIVVQHNIIQPFVPPSPDAVMDIRDRLHIEPRQRVILSVGRLSREKGHLDLIEAIAILCKLPGFGPFRLLIAGDGPDRALMEKRVAELNLSSIVDLVGHQSNLNAWYSLAYVMALPSHSEGSPNVLLEAFAAGVPTVACAVGGVPEIATHKKDSLLVPSRDPQRMAENIAALLSDESLRNALGKAALEVTNRFSPEAYCHSMLNVYAGLLR